MFLNAKTIELSDYLTDTTSTIIVLCSMAYIQARFRKLNSRDMLIYRHFFKS